MAISRVMVGICGKKAPCARRKAVDALGGLYKCLSAARTQMKSSLSLLEKLCEGI